jgi:hypothetical protein
VTAGDVPEVPKTCGDVVLEGKTFASGVMLDASLDARGMNDPADMGRVGGSIERICCSWCIRM